MTVASNKTENKTLSKKGITNRISSESISSAGQIKRKNCVSYQGRTILRNYALEDFSNDVRLLEVELDLAKKSVLGLGMQNIHGGISFYCKGIEAPVTLGEKMYSKYNHLKTSQSLSLCVFMYFTDYLAFMKLQKKVSEFRQISCPDILIINDIDNYISALIECDTYHDIYFFLPNDDISRMMTLTALDYNKRVVDYSALYKRYNTLFESLNYEYPIYKRNKCINCCACCGFGQNYCSYLCATIEDMDNPPCEEHGGYPFDDPNNFNDIND